MEQLAIILDTVVPVFGLVGLGYFLAGRRLLPTEALTQLLFWVLSPALVFSLFTSTDFRETPWFWLLGGVVFIMLGTGGLAYLYHRLKLPAERGILLPALFWNAGNMGLPCVAFAFGPEARGAAAVVFVSVAALQAVFGIWIAKGHGGFREMLRMPLVHASLIGVLLALAEVKLPPAVSRPVSMLGEATIPLMLLNLGFQLRGLRLQEVAHSVVVVAIRMGGGLFLAWLFVRVTGMRGMPADVLLLEAIMPSAVITIVFAQRYRCSPTLVASTIVLSTLASMIAIPLLLAVLLPGRS